MGYKISQLNNQATFDSTGYVAVAYGTETKKMSLSLFDIRYQKVPPDDKIYIVSDFATINQVTDVNLNGKRFRVIWQGYGRLDKGADWDTVLGGGFKILIPGFDVTLDGKNKFFVEFY